MFERKILKYLTLIFFIYSTNSYCLENKILVKVEKEIITSIDVDNESRYLLSLNKNIKNLNEKEIYQISKKSIIKEKIQSIEILKNFKDPKVPDEYLKEILKNIYQRIGIKDLDNFKEYLKKNDIKYQYVKDKIEIEALWNDLIIKKFSSKIKINEEEIRQKILTNNKKFLKSFLVSEIFFETSNTDEIQVYFNKIKKTIEEKGFNNAALTFSTSDTSDSGGKLGWINEESLNDSLKSVFLNMKKNEFTDPITVPGGFLVLKIDGIKEIKKNQNKEEEVKKLINIKKNDQLNQFSKMYFNKIKKDIQINEL